MLWKQNINEGINEHRIYLPLYCRSIIFNKDGDEIDVHLIERNGKLRLEITPVEECNRTFVVKPIASNVVWIEMIKE